MAEQTPKNPITSVLKEHRQIKPTKLFQEQAHIRDMATYQQEWEAAKADPVSYWRQQALAMLQWHEPFSQVLDWQAPHAKWFADGTLNVAVNCLDRHLPQRAHKPAIIWEGEPGDTRVLTYADLHREVCQCANALIRMGIKSGDRVTIYMPMVPEIVIAVLACARLGVMHNVVFGGFSSDALADRNNDAQATLVITADGGWRRGQIVELKKHVDESLEKSPTVKQVIVLKRTSQPISMKTGRDHWWHEVMNNASEYHEPQYFSSEQPLFLLYTSGSTGKPKGILHTSGGYLLNAAVTFKNVFDYKDSDIFWCTADVGWVTGHSYVVYGPLANGATTVMYEGAPMTPDAGRFWQMIEKHRVSIFYTAPTAIRTFIKMGDTWPQKYDLSSLRLLGTVGEPINPEAWMWYRKTIGGDRCPIVDTWWQTETGSIMISPLPGATTTVPGSATRPMFGVVPEIVDKSGQPVPAGQGGFLVISQPWPGMLRGIYGDEQRYRDQYWSQIPGKYFTGDGARQDADGNFWILGRIDDVLNVSGHRLSTMEIESTLVSHAQVAEAAVVGMPHDVKGEAICCFVTLKAETPLSETLKQQLSEHIVQHIGALARPETIRFTDALPKTRSGKIMRRLLRDIAAGKDSKADTSTLEDFSLLAKLRQDED